MFKEKRDKFYFRINKYEKGLLEEKAKQYGYKDIGTYIRDSSIYENIHIEEIEGKKEILESIGDLVQQIKMLDMELMEYKKKNLFTYELIDIAEKINSSQQEILAEMKKMSKIVNDKLFVNEKKEYFKTEQILSKEE